MIKKIINYFIYFIKNNYKQIIILLITAFIFFYNFDYYVFSPGGLISLDDRINIENRYEEKGSFNLTYVTSRPGSILNIVLSKIIPTWDLVSLDDVRVENESEEEIFNRDKIYLKETSYDAIIAAFKAANKEWTVDSVNIIVTYIFDIAKTDLQVGDIIKSINGKDINNYEDLKQELLNKKENEKISLKVLRDNKLVNCYSILVKEEDMTLIGISLAELKNVKTNPNVEFVFKDSESGSSRGLMCALEIYNRITEYDLTKGRKIAGTGSIDENGNIGVIDGVKYKLKGAVNNKADVFIVPSKNYEEAIKLKEKYNYNIEIIEADTLENLIEKLK